MDIQILLFILLISMVVFLVGTPAAIRLAPTFGLVDKPGGRKIHSSPIPRVGGILFLLSIYTSMVFGFLFSYTSSPVEFECQWAKVGVVLVGTFAAGGLGFADDLLDLRPAWKFGLQALLAGSFTFLGYRFDFLHIPGFPPIHLAFFSVPFTSFWIMALMNGFNFMDGVDGLAGSVSAMVFLGLGLAAYLQSDLGLCLLAVAALGALVVFLVYNRPPAKIYLGDAGANALGFAAAAGLVSLGQAGPLALGPVNASAGTMPYHFQVILATLIVGYPFLEVSLSTIRRGIKRFYFGRSMEWSEKEHIHHRLLKMGWTPLRISAVGAFFNLFLVAAALLAMSQQKALAVFCFLPVVVILTVLMPRMGFFDFADAGSLAGKRPYYLMAHRFLDMQRAKLKLVADRDEALALASQTCAEFGVQGFWIKADADAEGKGGLVYYWERPHDIQREYLRFLKTEINSGNFEVFRERTSVEDDRMEAYWIFEPNAGESELDVEYRVLVSGFMKDILRRLRELEISASDRPLVEINNLGHAKVRSSLLRRRYGVKSGSEANADSN